MSLIWTVLNLKWNSLFSWIFGGSPDWSFQCVSFSCGPISGQFHLCVPWDTVNVRKTWKYIHFWGPAKHTIAQNIVMNKIIWKDKSKVWVLHLVWFTHLFRGCWGTLLLFSVGIIACQQNAGFRVTVDLPAWRSGRFCWNKFAAIRCVKLFKYILTYHFINSPVPWLYTFSATLPVFSHIFPRYTKFRWCYWSAACGRATIGASNIWTESSAPCSAKNLGWYCGWLRNPAPVDRW